MLDTSLLMSLEISLQVKENLTNNLFMALYSDEKTEDLRMRRNHFTFNIAFSWESLKEIRNKLAKKHHFTKMEITNLF